MQLYLPGRLKVQQNQAMPRYCFFQTGNKGNLLRGSACGRAGARGCARGSPRIGGRRGESRQGKAGAGRRHGHGCYLNLTGDRGSPRRRKGTQGGGRGWNFHGRWQRGIAQPVDAGVGINKNDRHDDD